MRLLLFIGLSLLLVSCWPSKISFVDGTMPEEWEFFSVKTLDNNAPNAPLNYAVQLSEDIKDGVQNSTKLKLSNKANTGEVQIEGSVSSYSVSPIAIQAGDLAAKNRLTISISLKIITTKPKQEEMTLQATRFSDFESSQDLSSVEQTLISDINKQLVQDVINKLLSNW